MLHRKRGPRTVAGAPAPWVLAAVAAAAGLVLAVTLGSGAADDAAAGWHLYRLGEYGASSVLLNVALFVPLGVALSAAGIGPLRVIVAGALLSTAVELAQLALPGRYSTVADVVLNTGGAGAGALLYRAAPRLLAPGRRAARWLAWCWAAALLGLTALAGVLILPALGDDGLVVQWNPELGGMERFDGTVLDATIDELALGPDWMSSPGRFRQAFVSGAPLRVRVAGESPRTGLAPIVRIVDPRLDEIVLLATDGPELVFRYRTRAAAVRLHQPDVRIPAGALAGTTEIIAARLGRSHCLGAAESVGCGLGTTVGRAWAFLRPPSSVPPWARSAADMLWLALIFAPLGLWARRDPLALSAAAMALAGLLATPQLLPLMPTPGRELLAAVAGVLAGAGAGALARRASTRSIPAAAGQDATLTDARAREALP